MFKKLLLSLSIVTAVGAAGIMGTQALLSDDAVLGTSTFSTGTVDLQISKDGDSYNGVEVNGFEDTLRPGESKVYEVWLQNATTDVALGLAGAANDVAVTNINPDDVTITFTEVNGDGATISRTLTQWDAGQAFSDGFNLPANSEQEYTMTVALDSDAPGGSFNFDFQFTGTQIVPTP